MSWGLAQVEAEANSLKGKLTIGTISVACALGYLDYRGLARQASQARQMVQFHRREAGHEGHPAARRLESARVTADEIIPSLGTRPRPSRAR
jgi:hypothetical protein